MTMLTRAARRGATTTLALTLTLGLGVVTAQNTSAAVPATVSGPVERADRALARARTLAPDHPGRTNKALLDLKRQVSRANKGAMGQIGRPPTDPESDDLPGPPAVLAVLSLDHRVTTTLVTLFNGQARTKVVETLLLTLRGAHRRRDALLGKVLALPPEGDRDDYADDLADRLAIYTQEVNQLSSALTTYSLTPAARDGLGIALTRVRATKARMDAAFGGGE